MIRWLADTIAGRTIIVLALGLCSIMALAQYLYQTGLEREITAGNTARQAERLLVVAHSLSAIDQDRRDDAAHNFSGGPFEMHWGREPSAVRGGSLDAVTLRLRDQLIAREPRLANGGLVIGTSRGEPKDAEADPHTTLVSLILADGTWLNVSLVLTHTLDVHPTSLLLSIAVGALGVVIVATLMGRWLTTPVERLAEEAERPVRTARDAPFQEAGTREVRTLAKALNDMQARILRLVDDRTQMLAAVSHDLRTPLTRLRLRVARLPASDATQSIEADLDEMEAMINATLEFLRDETADEPFEPVDLAAILETIVADAVDAGKDVTLDAPRTLVVQGRHLALKRAFSNLVDNAVKYGGGARITAGSDAAYLAIRISDDGPGVPVDQLEAVFLPFRRLEGSRNRATGGHGLGLAVARSILRAHGGDVTLANRTPRGLEVTAAMPAGREAATAAPAAAGSRVSASA